MNAETPLPLNAANLETSTTQVAGAFADGTIPLPLDTVAPGSPPGQPDIDAAAGTIPLPVDETFS